MTSTEPAGEAAGPAADDSQPDGPQAADSAAATGEKKPTPLNNPQLPWEGRPRRVDILCWAGITLSGIYYLILLPFRADLVGTHPVVLEILNGSTEAIVAAAAFARVGHGSLAVVLLAAIPGLMKFDLLYWWAGRLWGERVIHLLSGGRRNRSVRYIGWVQRWGRKFTWPAMLVCLFLPIPNAIIYVIAGWTGMHWITFLILDILGSLLWAGMLAGLGYALGHHAVVIAQTISHYGLWFTLFFVALIIFLQVRRTRTMQREAATTPATGHLITPRPTPDEDA